MNTTRFTIEEYLLHRNITGDFGVGSDETRIIIPVHDVDGNFLFNKYRRRPHIETGPKYTYEKGSTAQLYNAHRLDFSTRKMVSVTEGEFDCMAMSEKITRNVVTSTGGAATFKEEWVDWLIEQGATSIDFCFDNDEAGLTAMARHAWKLRDKDIYIRCIVLPRFSDDYEPIKDVSDAVAIGGPIKTGTISCSWDGDHNKFLDRMKESGRELQNQQLPRVTVDLLIELCTKDKEAVSRSPSTGYEGEDVIAKVKQIPISEYIKFGYDKKGKCLWHNEKTESMHYYPDTNKIYCFGCQMSGDVVDVVQKLHNLPDVKSTIKFLKDKHNLW